MNKFLYVLIISTFVCKVALSQDTPKIISTVPFFADCKVNPDLKEIIIKFDQDMMNGYSIIDTKNLPKKTSDPIWLDKRTLSIPVKLYPAKFYSLLFNNSKFQGFRSLEGVPLNPDQLLFQTATVSYKYLNQLSYDELLQIFPKKYSYAARKGINWENLLEQNKNGFINSETPTEFALKLVEILRYAEDPHLWIGIQDERIETNIPKIVQSNSNSNKLLPLLKEPKIYKSFSIVSGIVDSIGYIAIKDWNNDFTNLNLKNFWNSADPEIPASEVLKGLLKYPNLIIDVRENYGGNEFFAKKFASQFLHDSIPYEKTILYNESSEKFDKVQTKWLYPNEDQINYEGHIYVLSGPSCMSTNESFILMMKQLPNTKIIGMKTYGSSGNPKPYNLSNGVLINIPSWQAFELNGELIEGNGIKPDIEINTTAADFQNKDALFEKVLSLIKNGSH